MKNKLTKAIITALIVIICNTAYALMIKLFVIPSGLVTGGTTGIALAIHHVIPIKISIFILIVNSMLLVIAFFFIGRAFTGQTLISTIVYPLALEMWENIIGNYTLTNDLLLSAVFAGLGIGTSLSIVLRLGASTGGMDIPPILLNKYFKIPVSVGMYIFDFIILVAQIIINPTDSALYGIIMVIVYSMVLNKGMIIGSRKLEVKIVSSKPNEIKEAIIKDMDRGVTMISITGGYLNNDSKMVYTVINERELIKAERLIRNIDKKALLVVCGCNEVSGRGFSMSKKYIEHEA